MNVLFMSPNSNGGTVTYTAHLMYALECKPRLRRYIGGKDQSKPRDFGYGQLYLNTSFDTLRKLVKEEPTIIAHAHSDYVEEVEELVKLGAWFVIHDPGDARCFPSLTSSKRVIVIREANLVHCPNATYIPHPFVRSMDRAKLPIHSRRKTHAVTLSRLASNKKTAWILEANRLLPKKQRIELRGVESRMYTWGLTHKYPEFKQDPTRGWPKVMGAAEQIAARARWLVDMTDMPGDGGGSQYTFLHAIDAGCAIMLNATWPTAKGVWKPGKNCLVADGPESLAAQLRKVTPLMSARLADAAYPLLHTHDPRRVARRYMEVIK